MYPYKKVKHAFGAALLCSAIMLFSGCVKQDKVLGSFTLKGYLMDSCGGRAKAGIPLQVSYKQPSGLNTKGFSDDRIGTAVTDSKGYFEIKCKLYQGYQDGATVDVFQETTRYVYVDDFGFTGNNLETAPVVDLHYIFENAPVYTSTVRIMLSGTFAASDTLYVRGATRDYFFYPLTAGGSFVQQFTTIRRNGTPPVIQQELKWGIGSNNISQSLKAAASMCYFADTTTVLSVTK